MVVAGAEARWWLFGGADGINLTLVVILHNGRGTFRLLDKGTLQRLKTPESIRTICVWFADEITVER